MLVYKWRGLILEDPADQEQISRALKEELRPEFAGEPAKDPITDETIFIYPVKKKAFKYTVSWCIIFMCIFIVARVMTMTLDFADINHAWIAENTLLNWWSKPFVVHGMLMANVPLNLYLAAFNISDMLYHTMTTMPVRLGEPPVRVSVRQLAGLEAHAVPVCVDELLVLVHGVYHAQHGPPVCGHAQRSHDRADRWKYQGGVSSVLYAEVKEQGARGDEESLYRP